MNEEESVLRIKVIELRQENDRLKRALTLWTVFAMDAGSMYESSLRYTINSIEGKVREILNESNK